MLKQKFMDQQFFAHQMSGYSYQLTECTACVVCHGLHKPLIGRHATETTAGQTQQLLILLSATDAMWFVWHIVSADNMNGWVRISGDCHSHEQKLY